MLDEEEALMKRNQIGGYVHCRDCVRELPKGKSPQAYSQLDIGMTPKGFQVWCRRHDKNVLHIDFQGQRHPAVT